MTTGREGSTDLVTLSGVPFVAPENNWKTGEMEKGGIPPFRGFSRSFRNLAKSSLQDAEVLSSLFHWKQSFRTSRDTISTGREE